jgi:hypothetical protein
VWVWARAAHPTPVGTACRNGRAPRELRGNTSCRPWVKVQVQRLGCERARAPGSDAPMWTVVNVKLPSGPAGSHAVYRHGLILPGPTSCLVTAETLKLHPSRWPSVPGRRFGRRRIRRHLARPPGMPGVIESGSLPCQEWNVRAGRSRAAHYCHARLPRPVPLRSPAVRTHPPPTPGNQGAIGKRSCPRAPLPRG